MEWICIAISGAIGATVAFCTSSAAGLLEDSPGRVFLEWSLVVECSVALILMCSFWRDAPAQRAWVNICSHK